MNDVYVADHSGGGIKFYVVIVNGRQYDSFDIKKGKRLTWSDQCDVAAGYQEALDNYLDPMID